jgi:hypothetical protein
MSLEHLSYEELCHWNIVTFIHLAKEISGSKNAVQLATLMSSAQYHMTPTWLARKQMIAAAKMLF